MNCGDPDGRRNSLAALKVICQRGPKCDAFEMRGSKGSLCKGEVKFGDGSDDYTIGMKGLKEYEGAKIFIKSRYKGDI